MAGSFRQGFLRPGNPAGVETRFGCLVPVVSANARENFGLRSITGEKKRLFQAL